MLSDPRVWLFLTQVDAAEAEACRAAGCPRCGGALHSARYLRKPYGLSADLRDDAWRFSLCCSVCRRRVKPPSVRFFGRRFYVGALIGAARQDQVHERIVADLGGKSCYARQSRTPQPRSRPMQPTLTEDDLVDACRETLRMWPEARAAVLFGSRARGTADPDSDWDVAIVLEGAQPARAQPARSIFSRSQLPADLPHVDLWAFSEAHLAQHALSLGTLSYTVCRDGRVLAGHWNKPRPAHPHQEPAMKPENWDTRMRQALQKVHTALTQFPPIAQAPLWADTGVYCAAVLEASADAAELLVKATMERRGVSADRSHNIAVLAATYAAHRPDDPDLANRLAALNGKTRSHHLAMYEFEPPDPSDLTASVQRLTATLDLWAFEIEKRDDHMAHKTPEPARAAAFHLTPWHDHLSTPDIPKQDNGHPAQPAAEALLHGRAELYEAIILFRDRIHRAVDAQPS